MPPQTLSDRMKLLLDILQGVGLSAAAGIRPFLPTLVGGGLAAADLGVDFEGTQYEFLEQPWFLSAIAIALVFSILMTRWIAENVSLSAALAGIGAGLGGVMFAGTLADHGYTAWPGLLGGLACAGLGQAAARDLYERVSGRLDPAARGALPIYFDGAAMALAGLSVLAPPVSLLGVGFLAWLLLGGKRREGEKYAGLRILR
jgi:hypothetical protein